LIQIILRSVITTLPPLKQITKDHNHITLISQRQLQLNISP